MRILLLPKLVECLDLKHMKNLLLTFLSITAFSAAVLSQDLYVSPNGSTDSFVYVKNQILYVENDIQLEPNNDLNADSRPDIAGIYLRDQAQLIQGNSGSPNSGTGILSVYQETEEDNAWDYSFWNSPVGRVDHGPAAGNQNFNFRQIIHDPVFDATGDNQDNTLLSNPAQFTTGHNGSIDPLTISTRWTYRYEPGSGWVRIYSGGQVTPGMGYIHKGVGTGPNPLQRYDFRGRPNNGDISFTFELGELAVTGNPYPSAIDLNRFFWDTENTEFTEILFFEEDRTVNTHLNRDRKSGYGVWVPFSGDPSPDPPSGPCPYPCDDPNSLYQGIYTPAAFFNFDDGNNPIGNPGDGGTGGTYPRRFAPIGQGFVVNFTESGNGTVTFRNSHRRYIPEDGVTSMFRNPQDPANTTTVTGEIDNRPSHLRLSVLLAENNNGETLSRVLILGFDENATDGIDRGFDGKHPGLGVSDAYFPIGPDNDREPFVIQGVPFELGKRVPIAFKLNQQNTIHIGVIEEVNTDVNPFLWDSLNNTWYPIDDGQVASILLNQGTYDNRFFIVFRGIDAEQFTNQTAGLQPTLPTMNFFQNNRAGQLEVGNPEGYDISSAHIFDMNGRLVLEQRDLGSATSFTFPTSSLSDGVYLVKLTTSNNEVIDYKISVFNK